MSVSTRAMKRDMTPPARIECTLTSSGVNPTWVPMILVAERRAVVTSALITVDHLSLLKTAAIWVSGEAL